MKRPLLAIALIVAACPPTVEIAPSPPSGKPTPPLEISATLRSGRSHNLRVRCLPSLDGELTVEVDLPEGSRLARGRRRLCCAATRGVERALELDFHADGSADQGIVIRATLVRGSARFTKVRRVAVNEGDSPPSEGVQKVDARGRAILEFRAR